MGGTGSRLEAWGAATEQGMILQKGRGLANGAELGHRGMKEAESTGHLRVKWMKVREVGEGRCLDHSLILLFSFAF